MFTEHVHNLTKCIDRDCAIKNFLKMYKSNIFNEELINEKFFTDHCLKNIKVFNAMCNLQQKGKENIEKFDHLISQVEEIKKENKS